MRERLLQGLFCSFALLLFCSPLMAQGCALCKAAVASQLATVIRSFNLGILVLLVPPVAIMSTILIVTLWHRD